MTDFLTDHGVVIALVCAAAGVLYGALVTKRLLSLSPGNERMQEISGAVQEGAKAYLNRQYTIIGLVAIVLAIVLVILQGVSTGIGFVIEETGIVPDDAGRRAAQRIAELTQGLTADDLVLCLVSGGASALLALPAEGITLEQKQAINKALLKSGAAIDEMNCVRKHLSSIKGGRLAARCAPAKVVTLLISDVPGDAPEVIGSGPTVPDSSTCADALAILARYRIEIPPAARAGLESGAFESPKPGDPRFAGHAVHMIATPQQSLEAAAAVARAAGIGAHILSDEIEGESREVGKVHAALARAVAKRGAPFAKPCVILSGGETTVTVTNKGGRGGRATEFLLGCAIALQGEPGVHVLAADTDGIDGIEDNAGAIVTPDTLARAAQKGLKAQEFLDRNDAYGFFAPLGDLVVPGPTFTNVNDFRALLVL